MTAPPIAPAVSGCHGWPDRDQCWRDFAGWRVNYDTVLLSWAELTMAPFAPWTADRSPIDHAEVKARRWGRTKIPAAE